ncbi:MAG: hypothetical protein Kow00124_21040 [Anaerolineae bacterium]
MTDQGLNRARLVLLDYVRQGLGLPVRAGGAGFDLSPYLALLPRNRRIEPLDAILAKVGDGAARGGKLAARPLTLEKDTIMPDQGTPSDVVGGFEDEMALLYDPASQFEAASAVVRKYAWAVPGQLGEPGVSLFEEFKLLSALVHAANAADQPPQTYMLVAGDFPGIQRAIYTITSKGAARGLRGRSAFLQLLGDAIVRRLVSDLALCWCNVVYAAGGNFLLLAPAERTAEIVADWTLRLSQGLLDSFHGDISFVTACWEITTHDLAGEGFEDVYKTLKQALARAKQQPFAPVAAISPAHLFDPWGGAAAQHCVVCHHDPDRDESLIKQEDDYWCAECLGFDNLARALADEPGFLSIDEQVPPAARSRADWRSRLYELTGWWYDFHSQPPTDGRPFYSLNNPDFLASGAAGFRFFATLTPRDRRHGGIRDFDSIAREAEGIERIGVLRMDVDSLGKLFGEGLRPLTLTRLSAASAAMGLFFDGWLNMICQGVEQEAERANSLYVIYAGGDDLFVVGPWDLMPVLAQRVHDDLHAYVAGNPAVTISAGIETVPADYPLYRAAERALDALDEGAKGHPGKPEKNAISFLGKVVRWGEDWQLVCTECDRLIALQKAGLPRSLIQLVRTVHAQHEEAVQKHPGDAHGRWMWMQAYQFARMIRNDKYKSHKTDLQTLQAQLMTPETIHLAGLVARWADYLLRERQGG